MKRVFICSPYRGDIAQNTHNAEHYCKMAIKAGYLPIAPHLYFTRFEETSESNETSRDLGIAMGIELMHLCDEMWVFGKATEGMKREIKAWKGRLAIKYIAIE